MTDTHADEPTDEQTDQSPEQAPEVSTEQPTDEAGSAPVAHSAPAAAGPVRNPNRERNMVRFLWTLLVVVVVAALVAPLVIGAAVSRGQERRALAHAVAYGMGQPANAVESAECHGDDVVACWRVDRPVERVADEVQWAIGDVLGRPGEGLGPDIRCERVPQWQPQNIPGVLPGSVTGFGSGFGSGTEPGYPGDSDGVPEPDIDPDYYAGDEEDGYDGGGYAGDRYMPHPQQEQELWSCVVATHFGDSGVSVLVDPSYVMGRHGERFVTGSLVSVTIS